MLRNFCVLASLFVLGCSSSQKDSAPANVPDEIVCEGNLDEELSPDGTLSPGENGCLTVESEGEFGDIETAECPAYCQEDGTWLLEACCLNGCEGGSRGEDGGTAFCK